jgi:hypothetical protein
VSAVLAGIVKADAVDAISQAKERHAVAIAVSTRTLQSNEHTIEVIMMSSCNNTC